MGVKVTNNGYGTLSAGIASGDTTITLDGGQGARFPTLGAGDYFYATLIDTSNNLEIVKVTARSTDSMTVVRGADNTTARAFSIGDRFELRPTAALFDALNLTEGGTVSGAITVDEDGATVATFDRATSDGNIVEFRKNGTTVGSIGTASGDLFIGNGNTCLLFDDGTDLIRSANASGGGRDAVTNLGNASNRFKNLYLSGGIYLGGTGAANYLDDYEEGTYQATMTATSSGTITINSSREDIKYTKIGRMVYLSGRINISSVSSPSGGVLISLPFTIETGTDESDYIAIPMFTHDVNLESGTVSVFAESRGGSSTIQIYQVKDAAAWSPLQASNLTGSGNEYFYFNGYYPAA